MNNLCLKFVFASCIGVAPSLIAWALVSFTFWQAYPVADWPNSARFVAGAAYAILGGIALYVLKDD